MADKSGVAGGYSGTERLEPADSRAGFGEPEERTDWEG